MVEVDFPAGDAASIGAAWFAIWARVRDERELAIRAGAALARPTSVVLLVACLVDREERGLSTRLALESGWTTWEELARAARFGEIARDHRREIVHARMFDLEGARRAADTVADALERRVPSLSPSVLRLIRFVFEELCAKVVQHSTAPRTGVGWADVDPAAGLFTLGVTDCGVGILASLQRNPELASRVEDDAAALRLAILPGISGAGPSRRNMGFGLKALVELSDVLDAELRISSGTARLTRRTIVGRRENRTEAIPNWRGTSIELEARLSADVLGR